MSAARPPIEESERDSYLPPISLAHERSTYRVLHACTRVGDATRFVIPAKNPFLKRKFCGINVLLKWPKRKAFSCPVNFVTWQTIPKCENGLPLHPLNMQKGSRVEKGKGGGGGKGQARRGEKADCFLNVIPFLPPFHSLGAFLCCIAFSPSAYS